VGKSVHLQSFGNNAKKDIKAKALKQAFLVLLIVLLPSTAFAVSNDKTPEKKGSLKEEIKAYIQHHLKDSHDFYLGSYKDGDKKNTLAISAFP
jgi:F-type H+-transporting ATPase subunit a